MLRRRTISWRQGALHVGRSNSASDDRRRDARRGHQPQRLQHRARPRRRGHRLAPGRPEPRRRRSPVPFRTPELCEMTAVELADRLRRKQVSAREVMTAHLAQMERVNPRVNAIVTLVAEQAMANAAQGRRRDGTARDARRAARPAGGAQGPAGHRRHPHHARLAVLQGQRPDARRADRDAHARGRRDHGRQDQHARVRRRVADVQRRLRCDPQSLRPDEDLRRQQRRRGDGGGVPDAADCRRQRHGRLAAQPTGVLQRGRAASLAGPRAQRVRVVVAAVGGRSDRAHGQPTSRCS